MAYWVDIGADQASEPFRTSFVRIMRTMDPCYALVEQAQLATWLEYPCAVPGYEHDRHYAFGAFGRQVDTTVPERMNLVLLARHIGVKAVADGSKSKTAAELMMLGWTGAGDQATLDQVIDLIVDKGIAWLQQIGLADAPVRCLRPYEMGYSNMRLLHDRVCERALAKPSQRLSMYRRTALGDGEFWQLKLSK